MLSMSTLFETKLPLRHRVEVIIKKDNKILLSVVPPYPPVVTKQYYGLPGGGIETGDTAIETVQKECMEELGIKVKNIKQIKVPPFIQMHEQAFQKKTGSIKLDTRGQEYAGYHTTYYSAEFDKIDKSLYGNDNDQMKYQIFDYDKALDILKDESINFEDKKRLELFKKRVDALENI